MHTKEIQILLVEDNKADAMLFIRALKKSGLANSLIHLSDGAQALDFIFGKGEYEGRDTTNKPKVIFLDLKMPKVSGLEVLQEIKKDDRTRLIPVVMMTSSKEESDIIESHNLGVNSYVVKPVEYDTFSRVVKELGTYWLTINVAPQI
jgi:CheY-like chemotaxis protein